MAQHNAKVNRATNLYEIMLETIILLHASLDALGSFSLVSYIIDSWGFFRIRHSHKTHFYPLFQVFYSVLRVEFAKWFDTKEVIYLVREKKA